MSPRTIRAALHGAASVTIALVFCMGASDTLYYGLGFLLLIGQTTLLLKSLEDAETAPEPMEISGPYPIPDNMPR